MEDELIRGKAEDGGDKVKARERQVIPCLCAMVIYYFYMVPGVCSTCFTEQIEEFSAPNSQHINLLCDSLTKRAARPV